MYSVLCKKENAHSESIWSCTWDQCHLGSKKINDEEDERSRDSTDEHSVDYIITGGLDDLVKVWTLNEDNLEVKYELEGHSLGVHSVAVSSNGKLCASSSLDSTMRIWDLCTGEKIANVDAAPLDLWTLTFSPDSKFIIYGSDAGKIMVYNVETAKEEQVLNTTGKFTLSVAYSPDGKYIASGAIDGIIHIFDVGTNKLSNTLEGHGMPIRSLSFSPDSQLLLTASDDGQMKLYDVANTSVVGTLFGHSSCVLCAAFSPDGKHIVSGSSDKTVRIWEVNTRQCIHTFKEHNDKIWGVKFSPDNSKIISVSEDKCITIYSCPN